MNTLFAVFFGMIVTLISLMVINTTKNLVKMYIESAIHHYIYYEFKLNETIEIKINWILSEKKLINSNPDIKIEKKKGD